MRLLKLRIRNIASLRGEHIIDFEHIQSNSQLFAITGETGSGKSSILNSISLVLFGKVYKSNINQNDLVTLGEKEGQIELIFQSGGKNFYAIWRGKVRKQNGELYSTPQTPTRECYEINGKDFNSSKAIINIKIEELINMDFDQFTKCIILNQGEFAKFLTSPFHERKEILEKLYPGELLDSLSDQLKKEKDLLENQISEIDVELHTLKEDGVGSEEMKKNYIESERMHGLSESWFNVMNSIHTQFTSLRSYHGKYHENEIKQQNIKNNLGIETAELNNKIIELEKANFSLIKAKKIQEEQMPELQELLKKEQSLDSAKLELTRLQKEEGKNASEMNEIKTKKNQAFESEKNWQAKNLEIINGFKISISDLKNSHHSIEEFIEIKNQHDYLQKEIRIKTDQLKTIEEQGKAESAEIQSLKNNLKDSEGLRNELIELERNKSKGQQVEQKIQTAKIRIDELRKKDETNLAEEQNLSQIESDASNKINSIKNELLKIQTTLKAEEVLSAVKACLHSVEESRDEKCPVCHSHFPWEQVQKIKQSLRQIDLETLKSYESDYIRDLSRAEANLHQSQRQKEICFNLKKKIEADIKALEEEISNQPPTQDFEKSINELQKLIWENEKNKTEIEKLGKSIEKLKLTYSQLKKDLLERNELLQQTDNQIGVITTSNPFLLEFNINELGFFRDELNKYRQYVLHLSSGEILQNEHKHLDQNLKIAQDIHNRTLIQVDEHKQNIKMLSDQLKDKLNDKSASEILSEIQKTVNSCTEKSEAFQKELKVQELRVKDLQTRTSMHDDILKETELLYLKQLSQLKTITDVKVPYLDDQTKQIIQSLMNFAPQINSSLEFIQPFEEIIFQQMNEYKEMANNYKDVFIALRARLQDWEKKEDRIKLLNLKSNDLSEKLSRIDRLFEILGKDELRAFVLSLVEENLILFTNQELQRLCQGRYEIIHQNRKVKITPEFYILDKFRDGGLRKVSTLSGGETFMVSLAMALGLAEMTRGKAEIDSLFIDEGFGTLDGESLQDVLDMLKQIQNRGLMVGVISHVRELTSAIPVNLQLNKRQDGTSSMNVILN